MAENLMCHAHKGTSKEYRDNYERIFKRPVKEKEELKDGRK